MRLARSLLVLWLAAGCANPEAPRETERASPPGPPIAPSDGNRPPPPLAGTGDDLDYLRSYSLASHPDVLAAQNATLVAIARARQAGLFPNPVLTYAWTDMAVGRGSAASEVKNLIGVAQAFPTSNRIEAAREEAQADADLAAIRLDLARRELLARIDEGLAHFLAARAAATLADEQLARLGSFEANTAKRVAAGTTLESDLLSARVEVEKAKLESEVAHRSVATNETVLRATVGREVSMEGLKADLPASAPPLDTERMIGLALTQGPSIELLEQQKVTAGATLRRTLAERWPDMTVAVFFGYKGDTHEPVVEGGIGIPLPIFNRNQFAVEAAKRDVERLDRSVEGERLTLKIAASAAARAYEDARLRVGAYREKIIPAAKLALDRTQAAYDAGKVREHELLVTYQALHDVEQAETDAREQLALAIAAVERLLAGPVPVKK
jgi:cobalt-zinc-cadmium efflux system outer membrane protein